MAVEVIRKLICDVGERHDGTHTLSFAVSGQTYEVDVCDRHGKAFDKDFGTWIDAGRKAEPVRRKLPASRTRTAAFDHEVVRQWAKLKGLNVSDSGRVGPTIIKQWREAGAPGT